MMKNQKIIISGPPGSGKTTIIETLKLKGYLVQNELHPGEINEKTNKLELSHFIFKERIKQYQDLEGVNAKNSLIHLDSNPLIFFDRSIVDVVAYMNFWKEKYPLKWDQAIFKYRYRKSVFFTPVWGKIYKTTNQRPESYEEATKIDAFLREAFLKFNYNIIEVPKLDINQRVNFILNNI